MKFTSLLTLLAATSALALNFKRDEQLNQLGQALGTQGGQAGNKEAEAAQSFACLGNLTIFLDKCYGVPLNEKTMENLNAASTNIDCKLINSNECQAALKALSSSKCGDQSFDKVTQSLDMLCAIDENGNACPFSETLRKYMENLETVETEKDALTEKDLENTCKSKKCTETALNIFNEIKKTSDDDKDIKELDKYINYLSGDQCKVDDVTIEGKANSANAADTDDTDDATQIKIGSALLATLALVLYF